MLKGLKLRTKLPEDQKDGKKTTMEEERLSSSNYAPEKSKITNYKE